jgi:hypothetical protein
MQFGDTTIDVYGDSTCITYTDGSTVTTPEYGSYDADNLRLCKEHDVMHLALCHWLGIESPTMLLLREGDDDRLYHLNKLEEVAVLSIQHLARAAGVDLVARMKDWTSK